MGTIWMEGTAWVNNPKIFVIIFDYYNGTCKLTNSDAIWEYKLNIINFVIPTALYS